ncbi:MAG TPA: hypothetical protein VGN55_12315 [Xanthobacteraceae bacterium]|jgi:hypothetical protein
MRTAIKLGIAMAILAVAIPLAAYQVTKPADDPLGDALRGYGFVPIKPPSNLMNVGSLYYVDSEVKDFKAICDAEKADLDGVVNESRSWEMQENLEQNGRFATGVNVDLHWLFKGDVDNNYVQKVHSSLTDVFLEEIPLGPNWRIFAKLMDKPECNRVAMQYLNAGGYVCQGQKLLRATAEFKLDRDTQNKLATNAKATPEEVNGLVKLAVETQSDQSVVERAGRLFAGSTLKYGVSMNPICLAPPDGHFQRILPRTATARFVNFVLFSIVEPMLPAKSERV